MYRMTDEIRNAYDDYLTACDGARDDLEFLLDNLGISLVLDFGEDSLIAIEKLYWRYISDGGFPAAFGTQQDLIELATRYLAMSIVEAVGAKWVLCEEENERFGQACLDGFGNDEWDRVYPQSLAIHFEKLPKTNPSYAGVRKRQVLAEHLRRAIRIHQRNAK